MCVSVDCLLLGSFLCACVCVCACSIQEGKEHLAEHIANYIMEKIVFADRIIAKNSAAKIGSTPGSVPVPGNGGRFESTRHWRIAGVYRRHSTARRTQPSTGGTSAFRWASVTASPLAVAFRTTFRWTTTASACRASSVSASSSLYFPASVPPAANGPRITPGSVEGTLAKKTGSGSSSTTSTARSPATARYRSPAFSYQHHAVTALKCNFELLGAVVDSAVIKLHNAL